VRAHQQPRGPQQQQRHAAQQRHGAEKKKRVASIFFSGIRGVEKREEKRRMDGWRRRLNNSEQLYSLYSTMKNCWSISTISILILFLLLVLIHSSLAVVVPLHFRNGVVLPAPRTRSHLPPHNTTATVLAIQLPHHVPLQPHLATRAVALGQNAFFLAVNDDDSLCRRALWCEVWSGDVKLADDLRSSISIAFDNDNNNNNGDDDVSVALVLSLLCGHEPR
jgi:uncharacterized integral membrane protein